MAHRILLLVLLLVLMPIVSRADGIDWLVAPYAWLPSISMDQSPDPGGGGVPGSGKGLLELTESFFKFRAEAARNRWGISLDYIYLSLADQVTHGSQPPLIVDIETELDLEVVELGGFYRPSGEVEGVNYMLGVRRINADTTLFLTPGIGPAQRIDSDAEVTDVYLGARYLHQFSNRWQGTIRGDYSFGDSEGTLNLLASVGFQVAGPFSLQAGYRHAVIEFEQNEAGTRTTTEIELSGPYLGLVFRF